MRWWRRELETMDGLAARFSLRTRDVLLAGSVLLVGVACVLSLLVQAASAGAEVQRLSGWPIGMAGQTLAAMHRWLPLWLIGGVAFPVLATMLGICLAQGSATNAGMVDYRLGRLYDDLSKRSWQEYSSGFPETARHVARELSVWLGNFQRQQSAIALGRRSALGEVRRLRELSAREGAQARPELLETAARIEDAFGVRHLVVNLPAADSALVKDRPYSIEFQFEPAGPGNDQPEPGPIASGQPLGEPRHVRTVMLHLFGDGVEVAPARVMVDLPEDGASTVASAEVIARSAPLCILHIQATEARSVSLLQLLRLELPVRLGD